MTLRARLLSLLGFNSITRSEIRAETWALGSRHLGEVVAGAQRELNLPGVSLRRAVLLRAVIRSQDDL